MDPLRVAGVEKIEQDVQALSTEELAQFRAWFLGYEGRLGTANLSMMFGPASSTTLRRRPFVTTQPARPSPSDSPRLSRLLDVLPVTTGRCLGPRRS